MSRTGPTSTSLPPYITPTRSTNWAIKPMSWPTRITAAPRSGLHASERLHDLPLHHYIQSAGRLICDDDLWLQQDAHGDADALFHAAAQLMGIGFCDAEVQLDGFQRLAYAIKDLGVRVCRHMRFNGVLELFAHLHHGVQRVHGSLGNERNVCEARQAHLLLGKLEQVLASQPDFAAFDMGGRFQQAHEAQRRGRFAGSGFTDKSQAFAGAQVKADAVYGAYRSASSVIVYAQILYIEDALRAIIRFMVNGCNVLGRVPWCSRFTQLVCRG
jgi:hypothetical protein